jgi:SAM-dependent methyltransferase
MPFAADFDNVFYAIKAVADKLRATAERADRPVDQERITDGILQRIRNARLVVADITNLKPNVMYEVGYAHAIGKPVFLLTQEDISSVPFDIKDYNVLRYAFPVNLRLFESEIRDHLTTALERATESLAGPLTQALESVERIRPNNDLYATIVGVCLEDVATRAAKWAGGEIRVGPAETIDKGIEVFRHLSSGGFATSLVKIDDYWNSNGQYYEECRIAARSGRNIERVFLLSDIASIDNESLRSHIERDHTAGIKTFIAFDNDVLDKDSVRDFGIWDDQVVCCVDTRTEHGQSVPTGCTFSKSAAELSTARRWRTAIMQEARPASEVVTELDKLTDVQRLLRVSAPIMARKALEFCSGDLVDREDCTWYHEAWQYLRVLDLVSTPDWHSEFFKGSLRRSMGSASRAQVLICGAADYGMLQHVWSAAAECGTAELDITVVDLCPTPLRMCEWFSDRTGFTISTHQADALDLRLLREGAFDLIVTDAFLSRFTTDEKQRVVSQWRRLLKRRGQVVTTARIAGGVSPKVIGTKSGVDEFVIRAKEAFRRERWLWIREDELECLARDYAERIVSYPFRDAQELDSLFSGNGMNVLELEQRNTKGELHPNTVYSRLIAEFP